MNTTQLKALVTGVATSCLLSGCLASHIHEGGDRSPGSVGVPMLVDVGVSSLAFGLINPALGLGVGLVVAAFDYYLLEHTPDWVAPSDEKHPGEPNAVEK